MEKIEVSFEVFQKLTALRDNTTSFNDVISRILQENEVATSQTHPIHGTDSSQAPNANLPQPPESDAQGLRCKRVFLANGTKLRGFFEGRWHTAKIQGGLFHVGGETARSPSAAAWFVRRRVTNGWVFWEIEIDGRGWIKIDELRPR